MCVCMCIGKPIGNNSVTVHIHVVSYSNWQIPRTFVVGIFNFGRMTRGNCCFFSPFSGLRSFGRFWHTPGIN